MRRRIFENAKLSNGSELITESELNQLLAVETRRRTSELSARSAKRTARDAAVASGECVPIEEIDEVRFERQDVCLVQRETFDQREIFVFVSLTPNVTEYL